MLTIVKLFKGKAPVSRSFSTPGINTNNARA